LTWHGERSYMAGEASIHRMPSPITFGVFDLANGFTLRRPFGGMLSRIAGWWILRTTCHCSCFKICPTFLVTNWGYLPISSFLNNLLYPQFGISYGCYRKCGADAISFSADVRAVAKRCDSGSF